MKPAPFEYHRVERTEDALARLAELGDEAKVLAGGQSLVPMMNFRLVRPPALVDITRIPDLRYVERDGDRLRIGALTLHREVEQLDDPAVVDGYELLPQRRALGRPLSDPDARHVRRLGRPRRSRRPSGACSRSCSTRRSSWRAPDGEREIPAADFFLGFFTTAMEPGELLVEVRFPRPRPARRAAGVRAPPRRLRDRRRRGGGRASRTIA